MSRYVPLFCLHCDRELKVPSAYIGQRVICNHCNHDFLARPPAGNGGALPEEERETQGPDPDRLATTLEVLRAELGERVAEVERLKRSADDLITVRAERDQATTDLRAAHVEVENLRARLDDTLRSYNELEAYHEAECQSFRARIEELGGRLETFQLERDRANEQLARLSAEHDGCTDRECQWERTIGENECRHRSEIETLAEELRQAGHQTSHALRQVHDLTEQLRSVTEELSLTRTERDQIAVEWDQIEEALRRIEDQSRQEFQTLQRDIQEARDSSALAGQREAELNAELAEVRAQLVRQNALVDELRLANHERSAAMVPTSAAPPDEGSADATSQLPEEVERIGQERDLAAEQAEMLKLDRDCLYDSLARLEARLQAVEVELRHAREHWSAEVPGSQHALEAETPQACLPGNEHEYPEASIDASGQGNQAAVEPACESAQESETTPAAAASDADPADPIPPAQEAVVNEPERELLPGVEPSALDPPALPDFNPREDPALALTLNADETTTSEHPEDVFLNPPLPIPRESPEARILDLRNSLRIAHEASAQGRFGRPFFARLSRIWRRRAASNQ